VTVGYVVVVFAVSVVVSVVVFATAAERPYSILGVLAVEGLTVFAAATTGGWLPVLVLGAVLLARLSGDTPRQAEG